MLHTLQPSLPANQHQGAELRSVNQVKWVAIGGKKGVLISKYEYADVLKGNHSHVSFLIPSCCNILQVFGKFFFFFINNFLFTIYLIKCQFGGKLFKLNSFSRKYLFFYCQIFSNI